MTEQAESIRLERCVIVLDEQLPAGRAANAAAVLALTVGQRHPELVGLPLTDASGQTHPGLIPIGIAVLSATEEELGVIHRQAAASESVDVVDFPVQGQMTTNYEEFMAVVAQIPAEELRYLGLALVGEKKAIAKLVSKKKLFG
jgi:hypothetical protein